MPILVALLAADRQSTVYVDQPEVHLHPRAQVALASVLADAVRQGARMVIETHSALLLRGLQTSVAKGELSPDSVSLHWFTLDKNGATEVAVADLDDTGAFGDWPTDFDEVVLEADRHYLGAVEHVQSS